MKPDSDDDQTKWMKQIGAYLTIPFVLAVSPLIGWLLGKWLDQQFDTKPYLMYVGILLGFVAGFRELYRLLKGFGDGT